jgi:hypothetical protein
MRITRGRVLHTRCLRACVKGLPPSPPCLSACSGKAQYCILTWHAEVQSRSLRARRLWEAQNACSPESFRSDNPDARCAKRQGCRDAGGSCFCGFGAGQFGVFISRAIVLRCGALIKPRPCSGKACAARRCALCSVGVVQLIWRKLVRSLTPDFVGNAVAA